MDVPVYKQIVFRGRTIKQIYDNDMLFANLEVLEFVVSKVQQMNILLFQTIFHIKYSVHFSFRDKYFALSVHFMLINHNNYFLPHFGQDQSEEQTLRSMMIMFKEKMPGLVNHLLDFSTKSKDRSQKLMMIISNRSKNTRFEWLGIKMNKRIYKLILQLVDQVMIPLLKRHLLKIHQHLPRLQLFFLLKQMIQMHDKIILARNNKIIFD